MPNRSARGEFFIRQCAGDDQCIAENDSGARFQDAEALAEEAGTIGNVAERIVGIDGVESAGLEWKAF